MKPKRAGAAAMVSPFFLFFASFVHCYFMKSYFLDCQLKKARRGCRADTSCMKSPASRPTLRGAHPCPKSRKYDWCITCIVHRAAATDGRAPTDGAGHPDTRPRTDTPRPMERTHRHPTTDGRAPTDGAGHPDTRPRTDTPRPMEQDTPTPDKICILLTIK